VRWYTGQIMKSSIIETLRYFSQFKYSASLNELHIFHNKEIIKQTLKKQLLSLIKDEKVKKIYDRYTLGEYSMKSNRRKKISIEKVSKVAHYFEILQTIPIIKLVAITGSVAMYNAQVDDDVDIFIISSSHRMWMARFFAYMIASLLGIRRKRNNPYVKDTVCLNLFFDGTDVNIPQKKQNSYIAHEITQMKPVIMRDESYSNFVMQNKWIYDIYPNARQYLLQYSQKNDVLERNFGVVKKQLKLRYTVLRIVIVVIYYVLAFFGPIVEILLKYIQLFFILRHRTSERITETQLWFFPDDFEKKLVV